MIQGEKWKVLIGNNLDLLPTLADNSVDSIVTDPPYELGFMGKKWDSTGIAYNSDLWRECLRVLKPGGHLLSFGGTRTWHRIAVAIEDAGFEVRDSIAWMYGSGFPKSLDISKAIDKAAGAEREVIGEKVSPDGIPYASRRINGSGPSVGGNAYGEFGNGGNLNTAPATPEAQQWEGWGTALKPAFEPIIVARKPLIGTVADNVLTYGTGGLNIDASRVGTEKRKNNINDFSNQHGNKFGNGEKIEKLGESEVTGRWPANVILDEYTARLLDEQTQHLRAAGNKKDTGQGKGVEYKSSSYQVSYAGIANRTYNDSGGASRFFYVAKASKRDRNEGLEELPKIQKSIRQETFATICPKHKTQKELCGCPQWKPVANFHPTVKPTALMEYLIKLVTPPSGLVLDPFTGSGSTGKAAILEGFSFLGMEMTKDYIPIIEGRLRHAETQVKENEGLF